MDQITFNNKIITRTAFFNEPIIQSTCGRYRLARLSCVRPWRAYRRLPLSVKGHQWVGVGSGYNTRAEAIAEVNQHAAMKGQRNAKRTTGRD